MNTYTLEDFEAFPIIDGIRQCPSGGYTAIRSFPSYCSFDAGCRFDAGCIFGAFCSFGAGCRFDAGCSFSAFCSFGAGCRFDAGCSFSAACSFSACCSFSAACSFSACCSFEGYKAHPGYPLLTFGGAGSINRTVYAYNVEGGPLIRAGCFVGTLEEFRAKVRKDGDEMKSLQYLGFANIVAATWCPERVEK